MKRRPILWVLAGGLLLAAGGATALLLANRRPVTTSSSAAYEAYQEATERLMARIHELHDSL